MYLCNDIVKRVILANDYTKIRLVAAGTKASTRQDTGSPNDSDDEQTVMRQQFRVLDDAVPVVLPFIPPATVLPGQVNDLKLLLEAYYPLILSFDEPFRLLLGSKGDVSCLCKSYTVAKLISTPDEQKTATT
jgi:multisite-specific tRNA:(cytosine-C5)-methyltransferase